MSHILCPVCSEALEKEGKSYFCKNRHCFDIAKSGYVNLMMSKVSKEKNHGDDRLMVEARRDFLDTGSYDLLSKRLCELSLEYSESGSPIILDAGCGEGKYTCDILNYLKNAGKTPDIIGIDVSKEALKYASRRSADITLVAASTAKMPIPSESCDIVLNIFSPFMKDEFKRVLKSGGKLIHVYPLERHLYEMKEIIYDEPYENVADNVDIDGFSVLGTDEIKYKAILCNTQLVSLFKMTPYYYKTSEKDREKLENIDSLELSFEFGITVYQKEQKLWETKTR